MKYAKAILLTIAVGVLLDILIDVLIPDHVMNLLFLVDVGTSPRRSFGGIRHAHKESLGY